MHDSNYVVCNMDFSKPCICPVIYVKLLTPFHMTFADGCKQRHAIRRKRDAEKKLLSNAVSKLNDLVDFLPGREKISADQEASGEWPWFEISG